jgi:hypothetical protein
VVQQTLVDICKGEPTESVAPRELLSLPVLGDLNMHLRRSKLTEPQVTFLHDVCGEDACI